MDEIETVSTGRVDVRTVKYGRFAMMSGVSVASVASAVGGSGVRVDAAQRLEASVRLEVLWSRRNPAQFVTWGSELSLYELVPYSSTENRPSCIRLSDKTAANLVASNSSHHYVKCVDICPRPKSDFLLALGQANGKVVLTTFGPTDSLGLNGKEFVPRHARQCNGVAWNQIDTELLAGVLDKSKNDHCILLWDVTRSPCNSEGIYSSPRLLSQYLNNLAPAVELAKPIAEMGLSEHAHSLAWLHRQTKTLIVGMNQKQLKIFDLRDITNKAVSTVATKAVYGVCIDPFNDNQIASRVDNFITIWDRRMFEKPILSLPQAKAVTKISWCPTRQNLLGSLQRDSTLLHLVDLRGIGSEDEIFNNTEEDPPTALERSVTPGTTHTITSFCWHPFDSNRLITIAMSGTLTDYTVCERITLNWGSGSGPFVWSHGKNTLKILTDDSLQIDDISIKIKHRATTEYGLKPELWQNGDLADDDSLKKLWHWLFLSRSLVEEGCIRSSSCKHPGVKSVLKFYSSNGNTPGTSVHSVRSDFANLGIHNITYRSEDRDKALQLCGWNFDKDSSSLTTFLDKLETEKAYTRAAAIAVFNMKLKLAIDILNRGADKALQNSNLGIIAMALSGYSEAPGSIWRQSCSSLRHLTDAYVKGIFAFLTSENNTYDGVLNETGILVDDRVAFACIYLSDSQLSEYINQFTNKLIDEGNLNGIILTGTNIECLNLFQEYLDITGDVQSVSLIAARAFQSELLKEPQVIDWISSYRNLLDSWHFWSQRAFFDITINLFNPSNKPHQQIYISCNFCGKSVSAYMQGFNRKNLARIAATSNKFKQMSACPNCRKPLPRCAICLLHMGAHGAPITSTCNLNATNSRESHKSTDFSSWFTWCQTCRHGGHAVHMIQWFKDHAECPVSSCMCQCFSIDSVSSQSFVGSSHLQSIISTKSNDPSLMVEDSFRDSFQAPLFNARVVLKQWWDSSNMTTSSVLHRM